MGFFDSATPEQREEDDLRRIAQGIETVVKLLEQILEALTK